MTFKTDANRIERKNSREKHFLHALKMGENSLLKGWCGGECGEAPRAKFIFRFMLARKSSVTFKFKRLTVTDLKRVVLGHFQHQMRISHGILS